MNRNGWKLPRLKQNLLIDVTLRGLIEGGVQTIGRTSERLFS